MCCKVVLRNCSWDPGATYTKWLLHTVSGRWEWRTGRHSWTNLYLWTLAGNMDYSTECRNLPECLSWVLNGVTEVSLGQLSEPLKPSVGVFTHTPLSFFWFSIGHDPTDPYFKVRMKETEAETSSNSIRFRNRSDTALQTESRFSYFTNQCQPSNSYINLTWECN